MIKQDGRQVAQLIEHYLSEFYKNNTTIQNFIRTTHFLRIKKPQTLNAGSASFSPGLSDISMAHYKSNQKSYPVYNFDTE